LSYSSDININLEKNKSIWGTAILKLKKKPIMLHVSFHSSSATSKNFFQFHYVVGRGGFGKVWKVEMKKTKHIYAMKEMLKARILARKSVQSVINERKILQTLKNP
jgi:serine/threonine protein kinase